MVVKRGRLEEKALSSDDRPDLARCLVVHPPNSFIDEPHRRFGARVPLVTLDLSDSQGEALAGVV